MKKIFKKKHFLLLSFLLMILCLAGCEGNRNSSGDAGPEPSPAQSGPSPIQPEPSPVEPEPSPVQDITETPGSQEKSLFQAGTWLGTRENGSQQYYFFDDGSASGQTISLESGMGLGFAYEYEGGVAVFHMGGADDNTPCTVLITDEEHITLQWDGGETEELSYVSPLGADEFVFYSNDELCELALAYYRNTAGSDSQDLTAGAVTNEDGTVTIQIYENLGDHNSTAAWYMVDRFTGQGKDVNSTEAVDLTSVAP